MKIFQVEDTTVRDYKKFSRMHDKVMVGTIYDRTVIPIIGDGGRAFEGEDHFEIVRYTEKELKKREERREKARAWWNVLYDAAFDPKYHDDHFPLDEADFRLKVIPPSEHDPCVLVEWRLRNCYELEGTAEILVAQPCASHIHESDDGSMIRDSGYDMMEYLLMFKLKDKLRAVPNKKSPWGSTIPNEARRWVYFMHWATRYGEPFLSVTRKTVEAVERRKEKSGKITVK